MAAPVLRGPKAVFSMAARRMRCALGGKLEARYEYTSYR